MSQLQLHVQQNGNRGGPRPVDDQLGYYYTPRTNPPQPSNSRWMDDPSLDIPAAGTRPMPGSMDVNNGHVQANESFQNPLNLDNDVRLFIYPICSRHYCIYFRISLLQQRRYGESIQKHTHQSGWNHPVVGALRETPVASRLT